MLREVTEKGWSIRSRDGNRKCGDNSEEEVLSMVGVTVSGKEIIWWECSSFFHWIDHLRLGLGQNEKKTKILFQKQGNFKWYFVWVMKKSKKERNVVWEISDCNNATWMLIWRLGKGKVGRKIPLNTGCIKIIYISILIRESFPIFGFWKPCYLRMGGSKHKFPNLLSHKLECSNYKNLHSFCSLKNDNFSQLIAPIFIVLFLIFTLFKKFCLIFF